MRRSWFSLIVLLFPGLTLAGEPPLVFMGVTVVDVESGRLVADRVVVVQGKSVTAVGAANVYVPPPGATVVPSAGKYVIPGLWDMHVHHTFAWPGLLDLALVSGVTGVRDLQSDDFLFTWRDEIRDGKRVGPRIVASGVYLDARREGQPPDRKTADTLDEGRELVRARKKQGADFVKVYSGLRPDVYAAILDEAKAQKLPVAGHCPELVPAAEASRLGQRSFEHLAGVALSCSRNEAGLRKEMANAFAAKYGYDVALATELIERAMETPDDAKEATLFATFKKNGTWQVPTLTVLRSYPKADAAPDPRVQYLHPALTQLWGRMQAIDKIRNHLAIRFAHATRTVRAMHKAGVLLLAGTDSGGAMCANVFPGFSVADELELFVGCGLTPAEALRTATLNPALFFGEEKSAGTVATGKRADLVLLDADPLAAIGNVRKVSGVVVAGKWLPKADLDGRLKGLMQKNPSP